MQYTAAAKTSSLENTARAMFSLAELLKKDHILPTILSAPTLTARDKGLIVTELLKHTAGADKNETVKNFLKTLADNNRLSILEGICEKFGTLISVHRGEVEMVVTSAAVGGFLCCSPVSMGEGSVDLEWALRWTRQTVYTLGSPRLTIVLASSRSMAGCSRGWRRRWGNPLSWDRARS